jgi:CBS-domain-containing membrane protein
MFSLALLDQVTRGAVSLPALVPPFGASVVIVFFTPESPLGRPWNVMVGHLLSALVASSLLTCLPGAPTALLAALAVSGAGLVMLATRSVHPPGGATALLAVIAERKLGFAMMLCPALVGAVALSATRLCLDLLVARIPTAPRTPAEQRPSDQAQPAR